MGRTAIVGKRVGLNLLVCLLISILASTAALAQSTAQVTGIVKDQTGAVLPGVEVLVTQTDTGLARTAVTDETGSYVITNLPVGPYRFEAALPGFRTYVQTGIVLQIGGNPVISAVLAVGQVADQVEVQADAALVETRSTGVGQVMDNVRVLELPLNGRQATELILLSGAAVGQGAGSGSRNYPTTTISLGGGMTNGLTFTLDGGAHNDPHEHQGLPLPFPDALQEFKVETSAATAQYGNHSAGAVNAVTKSGTNDFHGSLFEFVRNKVFNARNAFALTRDGLKRNQFGGVLGGPVVTNKLFFFGGYQGTIERSQPTDSRSYIPTPAMLAGDWTTIASTQCRTRAVTLRTPFSNNRIDPALFVAPALNLLKQRGFPTTSDPCGEVRYGRKSDKDEQIVIGKMDYQLSDKHSLFGRYQLARLNQGSDYDGSNLLSLSVARYENRVQSFVFGDTYLLGANTVSAFRATVLRTKNLKIFPENFFTLSDLGVKNVYFPPDWPKLALVNAGVFRLFSQPSTPGYTNSTVGQLAEDISSVHGAHQIGFGVNYLHELFNVLGGSVAPSETVFDTTNTGLELGDFMLGKIASFTQQGVNTYYLRRNYLGAYLQDTWKATSRLTLNGGVRFEPYLSPWEHQGRVLHFKQEWFDQGLKSTVYKNAPAGMLFRGDPGVPDNDLLTASHWMRLAPRLGLAWDPGGNGLMTVRAAYGLFFDYSPMYQWGALRDEPPWGGEVFLENPQGGFADPWQGVPGGNPFPFVLNPNIAFPLSGTYVNPPLDLKTPHVNHWNLSIQRQIGSDWLVAANYIGNSVIHLLDKYEGNPSIYLPGASCVIAGVTHTPCSSTSNTIERRKLNLQNPDQGKYYGYIINVDDGGTRNYNALWMQIQRRRSGGLTAQANYTWSHCIEDGHASGLLQNNGGKTFERRRANRGNCSVDRRHNFNLSTVYETPQFSNSTLRAIGSGWKVSGIVRLLSGSYMTIASGRDSALSGTADRRPDLVLLDVYAPNKSVERYLNPAAFAQPALGMYGNLGANNVAGPGSIRIDMGLTRTFDVRENQSVEFRAEAFNLPNHMNPGNPNTTLTNANFGRILSASDPRIMQLALKYVF